MAALTMQKTSIPQSLNVPVCLGFSIIPPSPHHCHISTNLYTYVSKATVEFDILEE
jgi:hypothetical protein